VVGIVLVFMVAPGGFAGAIWGAIAAGAIFVSAFALPLIVLALGGNPLPFPGIGDQALWDRAVAQLSGWNLLGVEPSGFNLWIVVALAVGLSVLVPVVAPAFGAPDRRSARRAGGGFDSLARAFRRNHHYHDCREFGGAGAGTPLARSRIG
jgi:Na+(H+)/acetate symporter ActP